MSLADFIKSELGKSSERGSEKRTDPYTLKQIPLDTLEITFYVAVFIMLLAFVIPGTWYITKDVLCGDGNVQRWETNETCCLDVGCGGEQRCERNRCIKIACEECQYFNGSECLNYECCSNQACPDTHECQEHECVQVRIGPCQYLEGGKYHSYECCDDSYCKDAAFCQNLTCQDLQCGPSQYPIGHQCQNYACQADSDCNDGNQSTSDHCQNPSTPSASCFHTNEDKCSSNKECRDSNVATRDLCMGAPRRCQNVRITECTGGDSYCPPGCEFRQDSDCLEGVRDCSNSFDCFLAAAKTCQWSTVIRRVIIPLGDKDLWSVFRFDLKQNDKGACTLNFTTREVMVQYTDYGFQQLQEQGLTSEEIDANWRKLSDQAGLVLIGKGGHCDFALGNLGRFLERLNSKNFEWSVGCSQEWECQYSGDWLTAEKCEGYYFVE